MYMKNRDTVVTTIIRWSGFKDTVTLLGSLDRVRNGYSRRRHRRVEATDSSTSSLWQMLGATHSQRATCSCPHPGPPCASGSTNPAPSFHQQCIYSFLEQEVHVIHVWHHKIKQNLGNLLSKFIGIWKLLQLLQLYWSSYQCVYWNTLSWGQQMMLNQHALTLYMFSWSSNSCLSHILICLYGLTNSTAANVMTRLHHVVDVNPFIRVGVVLQNRGNAVHGSRVLVFNPPTDEVHPVSSNHQCGVAARLLQGLSVHPPIWLKTGQLQYSPKSCSHQAADGSSRIKTGVINNVTTNSSIKQSEWSEFCKQN